MKSLRRYLEDEHKDKKSQNLRLEFETKMVRNLPRQENGFDCGVFVCKAAEFLSDGMPLVYKQSDMGLLRKRMALEIMMKKTDSEIFEE
ncbi:hypothetical protein MHBO_003310 [Bonamia ostreae]|uniref:Ubiquitin-like protease family profile domain-containing protein n=1 Tax=Bonamia ostreae TaxID=126728 RepID=A0ABV2AQ28_9EUKA